MTILYHPRPDRWPTWRFSLRTAFVLLTISCIWLGVQVKWIHDRHEALREEKHYSSVPISRVQMRTVTAPDGRQSTHYAVIVEVRAPWGLRILGEKGIGQIHTDAGSVARLQSLFPEAGVFAKSKFLPDFPAGGSGGK